jgi:hypothetical protein
MKKSVEISLHCPLERRSSSEPELDLNKKLYVLAVYSFVHMSHIQFLLENWPTKSFHHIATKTTTHKHTGGTVQYTSQQPRGGA